MLNSEFFLHPAFARELVDAQEIQAKFLSEIEQPGERKRRKARQSLRNFVKLSK